MALTQKEITGLKVKVSAFYEWDDNRTKGTGRLGVKVYPSGNKTFVFRYYKNSKRVFIPLGRFPDLSLSDARDMVKGFGLQLKQGVDPKEHREATAQAKEAQKREESRKGTIKQLFHSYTAQMKKDGKRTYETVLTALEKEVFPHIPEAIKAKDVTTHDIILVLSSMIKRGAVTQSNRVRSYLMAAFNYGLKHDNDPANYIDEAKFGLVANPVATIPKQKDAERVGEHYLSNSEVHSLLDDLQNEYKRFKMGSSIRHLIQLCFYMGGQRPYELAASKWSVIDWEQKTFLVTSDVSKNKRPHIIPLTESAIHILKQQRKECRDDNPFIFQHRFDDAKHIRLDSLTTGITRYKNATEIRPFVARDIRRTCKTLMGELGISKSLRDRLQNHALNDVSSKHYDRYEYLPEKRRVLEVWEQKLNGADLNNIVVLGRAYAQ